MGLTGLIKSIFGLGRKDSLPAYIQAAPPVAPIRTRGETNAHWEKRRREFRKMLDDAREKRQKYGG